MAKSFYFWQTVSKKAKFDLFGLFKGQMATLFDISKVQIAENQLKKTAL